MNDPDDIKKHILTFPESPGIYQFFNKNNQIIYVGKAKNLKKRVASYFGKNHTSYKTQTLVRKVFKIDYIVVENETDALLLENTLIKKLQPAYNVLLKDDKTYPWICIKNENYSRIFYTRQKINDGSSYFGPFTSVFMVKTLLNLVRQLYPLRTCNLRLSPKNIAEGKFSLCLEYHIGNCMGPCENLISEEEYKVFVDSAQKIIKGDIHIIQNYLFEQMNKLSKEYKYEEALKFKEKLDIIENYKSKSVIVNPNISNLDVFAIVQDINSAYINYLKVQNGAVIQAHTVELRKRIEESDEDLLITAIIELRYSMESQNSDTVVPFNPNYNLHNVKWIVPKRGDKLKLLELSERNAKFHMLEKHKRTEKTDPERHTTRKLETLKNDLKLKNLPHHIECFDISGIQGTNNVAACVVFRNAKASKKEYRHFNIKSVDGQDDFAAIGEVVLRRYSAMINENQELPDLIIIDGGKGQLNAAVDSLKKLEIYGKTAIVGIAKRLEEIYFPFDSVPLYLDKNSESLKLIQQARNEAHRFGIGFHRNKRSGSFIKSEINVIKGIGEKTTAILLRKFKSVQNIKTADIEEISKLIGKHKASILLNYFKQTKKKLP